MKRILDLACIIFIAASMVDAAQRKLPELPELNVPKALKAPEIDGVISEDEWKGAGVITELKPHLFGKTKVVPTQIRLLWDTNYLYVAFECEDDSIYSTGTLKHDDLLYKEDVCEVFIDGVGDGKQYVEIQANLDGVNFDKLFCVTTNTPAITSTGRMTAEMCNRDLWRFAEWDMEGLITSGRKVYDDAGTLKGWNVEMAIPAEDIMKRKGKAYFEPTKLRANFMRYKHIFKEDKHSMIHMNWSPVQFGCPHISPARMGTLNLVTKN